MPFSDFENLIFTSGSLEQPYTIPGGSRSVGIQAIGGAIDMRLETGTDGKKWTFKDGDKETFAGKDFAGQKFYFTGPDGAVLQIRPLIGSGV